LNISEWMVPIGRRFHRRSRLGGAGVFVLLQFLSSCVGLTSPELPTATAAADHFKRGEVFFEEGKYAEAIKEYRYVAAQFPNEDLASDAQYKVAYTEIYFKNAASDYGMAEKDFQKLIQKYPNSPWKDPAQNWLSFLTQMELLKADKEKLKDDLQRLLDLDMQSEKKRRELK